jgi:hypothetical protein
MTWRARARYVVLLCMVGCERPATQIVVHVHSDLERRDGWSAVEVRAARVLGGLIGDEVFRAGTQSFPGEVRLVPYDPDDATPLRVDVSVRFSALPDDPRNFTQSAIVRFVPDATVDLFMALARRCTDPRARARCAEGSTCGWSGSGRSGCEAIERRALPPATAAGAYAGQDHACPVCLVEPPDATAPGEQCVDTSADVRNCGACGRVCAAPNATARPVCIWGECATTDVASCAWDRGDCDGDPTNGCEAALTTAARCGRCGLACAGAARAEPWCVPDRCDDGQNCSRCALACGAGFGDCNNARDDGCESSLLTDAAHCGSCGARCADGQQCREGRCGAS